MGNKNRSYLRNLALSLMGQLGISLKRIESRNTDPTDWSALPKDMEKRYRDDVEMALRRMNPETLGKIASCGHPSGGHKTSWQEFGIANPLLEDTTGQDMLLGLARAVVLAEMTDVIKQRIIEAETRSLRTEYRSGFIT